MQNTAIPKKHEIFNMVIINHILLGISFCLINIVLLSINPYQPDFDD